MNKKRSIEISGSDFYVCGGLDGSSRRSDCEVYSFWTNTWAMLPMDMPSSVYAAAAVSSGSRLFIIGGLQSGIGTTTSLFSWDIHTSQWEHHNPMEQKRRYHAAVMRKGPAFG